MNQNGVLTCGYIGFGNLGDEAVHHGLINALHTHLPDHPIRVMSSWPDNSAASFGCAAVPRWQMVDVWRAMRQSSLFVMGGGSLFQDVTSIRNSIYYGVVAMMARKAGCRVIWSGQGIGPLRRRWLGRWVAQIAAQAESVMVRDAESSALLAKFGYKAALVGADLAYMMPPAMSAQREKLFAIAPRLTPNLHDAFWQTLIDTLSDRLPKHGLKPLYIAMQPNEDAQLCLSLNNQLPGELLIDASNAKQVMQAISSCKLMLAVRLHALILGSCVGIPAVGIGYDPKVTALWQLAAPELLVTPQGASRLNIENALDTLFADTAAYTQRVRDFTQQQRGQAQSAMRQQLSAVV